MKAKYTLMIKPNGNIEIWKYYFSTNSCEYVKVYNPGDDLDANLSEAFKLWKELNQKGENENE